MQGVLQQQQQPQRVVAQPARRPSGAPAQQTQRPAYPPGAMQQPTPQYAYSGGQPTAQYTQAQTAQAAAYQQQMYQRQQQVPQHQQMRLYMSAQDAMITPTHQEAELHGRYDDKSLYLEKERFTDTESAEVRKRPGAARMSSRLVHRIIVLLASSGLHLTAADIRRQASTHEGPNLSVDTVHVVCEMLNLFGHHPVKKPLITAGGREALSMGLCSQKQRWQKVDWNDESKFLLFEMDEIEFVQHPSSTRYHPRHRLLTVKSGSLAVTVHGSFCGEEVGPFHHNEGDMDFKTYLNIMETVI
ncbi:hypothetical protein TELCIR_08537 [Teladorsagia circumcincta]|uniref:Uncharacterized protein n=1 Tax=Teladorsagia circumcincta TaxID=45464 RepID=A0A2G9UHL5_TELCI|nr:hypothetical protein TELCIR_08537 [Teladorsagia circumcincta]